MLITHNNSWGNRVRQIHKKNVQPFVLLSSLLFSSGLSAAQLGKLEVVSSANEPFLAKIQIQTLRPEERKGLVAKLASPEAFKAARLTMDPRLSSLKFEIKTGATADSAVIQVSSDQPIGQNFLDALVELSWSGGRVAREYTFTPADGQQSSEKTPTPPEVRPPQAQVQKSSPAPAVPTPVPRESSASESNSGFQELKPSVGQVTQSVQKGQTLSGLASKLTGNGVSLNQAMAAIYEANRGAFINNSVHQLRAGVRLVIPNKAELRLKSKQEALLVLAKNDDRDVYSRYARQLGILSVADQSNLPAATTQSQGKVESSARLVTPESDRADKLKISPSNTQASKGDGVAEELTAKNKALTEANERIALLEKNVSDLQKLLDMQKDMVDPSKQAQGSADAPTVAVEQPAKEEGTATLIDAQNASLSQAEGKAVEKEEVVKEKQEETPKEVEGGSLLPWLLGGAGAAVLSVLGLLVWRSRSKKKESDSFIAQEPSFDQVIPEDDVKAVIEPEELPVKPLATVSDDSFDLDQLLEAHGEDKPKEPMSLDVGQVFEPEEPELEVQVSEPTPAPIETTAQAVELEFPEEPEPQAEANTSILDDLDMLAKGAESAQAEIQAMRDQLTSETEEQAEIPEEEAEAKLDLDVPEPKAEPIDEAVWQEVATKLDLAGAYVEIGDADGAKELLNEIVKKGDADQISKAKALLETLD